MDSVSRNTLSKEERLSSGVALTALFSSGRYGMADFLKYCYKPCNGLPFNRIVVSVPKRLFRRAVKRNLLKRRIREAYRCNKTLLPVQEDGGTDILFVYNTKELRDFPAVTAAVTSALSAVAKRIARSTAPVEETGSSVNAGCTDICSEHHGNKQGSIQVTTTAEVADICNRSND